MVTTAPKEHVICACVLKTILKITSTHGFSSCHWTQTAIERYFARLDFNVASFYDFGQHDGSEVSNVSVVSIVIEILTHHTSQHMADNEMWHFTCSNS